MIDREELLAKYPIETFLSRNGIPVIHKTNGESLCCCPFHSDKHPSMHIDQEKKVWFCFPCGFGGSVIDLAVRMKGLSIRDAIRMLAAEVGLLDTKAAPKPEKVATYEYKDQFGRSVMLVDRIEEGTEKRFVQWHKDEKTGERVNGITGVQRVLYRMERWAGKSEVDLCEGEKCVEALEELGIDATTNPIGSNGWLESYSEYLKGKHINIWPDQDESGGKWLTVVLKSLEGKVASLRILKVPKPYNDVADVVVCQGVELATKTILRIYEATPRIEKGVILPIKSAAECWQAYQTRTTAMDSIAVDLGKWLPSFGNCIRYMMPGDMVVILSDTGVGKTTILANIAFCLRPLPVLIFELELSAEAMAERFIARDYGITTMDVETNTRYRGHTYGVEKWNHLYICDDTKLTIDAMEEIINRSELKIGEKPKVIMVDYIGLMKGGGGKRYERLSSIAEGLKMLARATQTVVFVGSQIRRDKDTAEIYLHDGKDSGSIEASAQLVLGAWRPTVDTMTIKICKQTKMSGTVYINCSFDGDRQRITEILE